MIIKIETIFIILVSIYSFSYCELGLRANPDYIRSSMAVTSDKVPVICIGDKISFKGLTLGGLIEVRNEKRFNQEIFPNHNWRGVIKAEYPFYNWNKKSPSLNFIAGLSHESAHPTMGILTETDKAYQLIYDKSYRRMILNAVNMGNQLENQFLDGLLTFHTFYHFYYMSKNTPELTEGTLTHGHGLSAGIQWERVVGKTGAFYLSFFDRYIFDSPVYAEGELYQGNGDMLSKQQTTYPVIHKTNTIAIKVGLNRAIGTSNTRIGLFTSFLYGNPFGFIDSRDKRTVFSLGFEISR